MLDHLRWALRLWRAEFDELEHTHRELRRGGHPCPDLLEALTALRRGDVDTAVRQLSDVTARGEPYPPPVRALWPRFQAEAAAASGDPELCAKARADLAPYGGQWAVAIHGWEVSGPMDLWLGVLDAALGRWDEAVERLTAARRSAELLQARPWAAEADLRLAQTLLARDGPGDAGRAATLLDRAEAAAADMGLTEVLRRVRRTRSQAGAAATGSPPPTPSREGDRPAADGDGPAANGDAAASGLFRHDGAVWTLGFAGRVVHLPDAKGLRDLHTLLGMPGADLPAVRLRDPRGGELVVAARRMGADPVLDEEAKTRYRRRLAALDEEIDRAVHRGDDDRAAELDTERAALLAELRTAAGLGGRTRRLGAEAERARKTVTARIRDVLRKLDTLHPELAAHLRASVSTGSTCRYRPDRPVTWRL